MTSWQVPILDMHSSNRGRVLYDALMSTGFVGVANLLEYTAPGQMHSIGELREVLDEQWQVVKSLDMERLLQLQDGNGDSERGYTEAFKEFSGGESLPELRDYFCVGQKLAPDNPLRSYQSIAYRDNITVDEAPKFVPAAEALLYSAEYAVCSLLDDLGMYMAQQKQIKNPKQFSDALRWGNHLLRAIYNRGVDKEDIQDTRTLKDVIIESKRIKQIQTVDVTYQGRNLKNAMRTAPHRDSSAFTLLLKEGATLNILSREGEIRQVTTEKGVIPLNCGNLCEYLIPGATSSLHWVNATKENMQNERDQFAMFLHPRPNNLLNSQPALVHLYQDLVRFHGLEENIVRDVTDSLAHMHDDQTMGKLLRGYEVKNNLFRLRRAT